MKFNNTASYNSFVATTFGFEGNPKDVYMKDSSFILSLYATGGVLVVKNWVVSSTKEIDVEFVGTLPAGSIMPVKGRQVLQCDGNIITDGTNRWQITPVGGNLELSGALSALQSTLERVIATQEGREAAMELIGEYFPDLSEGQTEATSEEEVATVESSEEEVAISEEDELAKLMAEESNSTSE